MAWRSQRHLQIWSRFHHPQHNSATASQQQAGPKVNLQCHRYHQGSGRTRPLCPRWQPSGRDIFRCCGRVEWLCYSDGNSESPWKPQRQRLATATDDQVVQLGSRGVRFGGVRRVGPRKRQASHESSCCLFEHGRCRGRGLCHGCTDLPHVSRSDI